MTVALVRVIRVEHFTVGSAPAVKNTSRIYDVFLLTSQNLYHFQLLYHI